MNDRLEIASKIIKRPELIIATEWWCEQLMSHFLNESGDTLINAATDWAISKIDRPQKHQIEQFKLALLSLLAIRCSDSWDDEKPNYGSACRTLSTDYGPDLTLTYALEFACINGNALVLPIKTIMWINPNDVKVRPGYHGKEIILYPNETKTLSQVSNKARRRI